MDRGIWRATDHTVGLGLAVTEPGAGVIHIRSVPVMDPGTRRVGEVLHQWERSFSGAELGGLLSEAVEIALTDMSDNDFLPEWVDGRLARNLLVPLQEAVLLAVAGADAFDRTFSDPEAS